MCGKLTLLVVEWIVLLNFKNWCIFAPLEGYIKTKDRKSNMKVKNIKKGMHDGIPIALGYLSVSFTFGLMAVSAGMTWWQAVLISMTNLTSAGQFAGLDIMIAGGSMLEMGLTQLVINLRYALMSISLSQKVDRDFSVLTRLAVGFGVTDEIFAVSVSRNKSINKYYMAGLIAVPYIGWAAGTAAGAVLGGVLPKLVGDALGIAIYGMFLAIIIPQARDDNRCLKVILIAVILSCCFKWLPVINQLSSGFIIIICAVAASTIGAILYPINDTEEKEGQAV